MKSSKNVIPKGKRKTIDSNIDQLEAEVAAILESEVSEKFMLEEEKLNEVRSQTKQTTKPSRNKALQE